MVLATQAIDVGDIKLNLKAIFEILVDDYENLAKKGTDTLLSYLETAKITENQKAEMFTQFTSGVIQNGINSALALSGDITKYNAELAHRAYESDEAKARTDVLKEQLKQEIYKTTIMLPQEVELKELEKSLRVEQIQTEDKQQEQITANIQKTNKDILLIQAQIDEQTKKLIEGGQIDQQTELYKQQAISFMGHNLAKAGDSIAQIVGMIVAEGGVPATPMMTAHSNIMTSLVKLGGMSTLTAYTTAK